MAESNENSGEVQTHPIIQALRETLRKMTATLSPDVAPADVYYPGKHFGKHFDKPATQEKSSQ